MTTLQLDQLQCAAVSQIMMSRSVSLHCSVQLKSKLTAALTEPSAECVNGATSTVDPSWLLAINLLVDAQIKIDGGPEGTLRHVCSLEVVSKTASGACSSQRGHVSTLKSCGSARENLNRMGIANWACSGSRLTVHVPVVVEQLFSPGPIWKLDAVQWPKLPLAVAACSTSQWKRCA